jgi:hypothetical protein
MALLANLIPVPSKTFSSPPADAPPAALSDFNTIASYSWMQEAGMPVLAVPGKFLKVSMTVKLMPLLQGRLQSGLSRSFR